MHHSGVIKDAIDELSAKEEEVVVPFEETRGDFGDEGTEEDENEASDLNEDERFRVEVIRGRVVSDSEVIIVGGTTVGDGGGEEEEGRG